MKILGCSSFLCICLHNKCMFVMENLWLSKHYTVALWINFPLLWFPCFSTKLATVTIAVQRQPPIWYALFITIDNMSRKVDNSTLLLQKNFTYHFPSHFLPHAKAIGFRKSPSYALGQNVCLFGGVHWPSPPTHKKVFLQLTQALLHHPHTRVARAKPAGDLEPESELES